MMSSLVLDGGFSLGDVEGLAEALGCSYGQFAAHNVAAYIELYC